MVWKHPDIELDDLMVCVRAFVDMLILTAGYQSTGHPASWDSHSVHRALQWSLFFEAVLEKLPASEEGNASKQELDKALLDLTSDPLFPQGLPQLSVATLMDSKKMLLGSLLQAVNLRENHLSSLLTVVHQIDSTDLGDNSKPSMFSHGVNRFAGTKNNSKSCHSDYVVQEITERHAAVNCTKSLEEGLIVLADSVLQKKEVGSEHLIWEENSEPLSSSSCESCTWDIQLWTQWKDSSLSYLLDKRTLSMLSGASLIFNTSKLLWSHVLESLKGTTDNLDDHITLEKVELCLLGLSSENWNSIIRKFTSATYQDISLSKLWNYLVNIHRGNAEDLHANENIDFKSREIEGYLLQLLANETHILWKMPSVLLACSLHLRSTIFSLYMDEIEKQIHSNSETIRYFSSTSDSQDLLDCDVAERIWCIYVAQLVQNDNVYEIIDNHSS